MKFEVIKKYSAMIVSVDKMYFFGVQVSMFKTKYLQKNDHFLLALVAVWQEDRAPTT